MFVPTTTITNSTYLVCSACGKAYPVFKKGFDRIDSPAKVSEAIRAQEQAQEQTRETYQEAGFSPKNQTVAVILALLLTTLGAPFFYIGKPMWGILCLVVSFLCIASGLFPLYSVIVIAGAVFAVLLGAGKVKDKDGRYIVSSRQREALQQTGSSTRL